LQERPLLLAILLFGFALALFGTYWDDSWHTEKGRDGFLAPPHVALYVGITLAGGALAVWALLNIRSRGVRRTLRSPSPLLALLGVGTTLGAAPIDNAWHLAFARDAVIWSPPHMLGVAGTLAIAAAMLLELSAATTPGGRFAAVAAGAGVVAAGSIPVLEYETDVPQFDLILYLPVLSLGSSFALGLVRRALSVSFSATLVTAAHLAAMSIVVVALLALSMPAPLLPALVLPALAVDWAARRRLSAAPAAALYAALLAAAYVPYLDLLKNDVFLGPREVFLGVPLAFLAAWASFAATGWNGGGGFRLPRRWSAAAAVLALATLVPLAAAPRAQAHDPGQGQEVATAALTASSVDERASLAVDLRGSSHCRDVRPLRLLARRAGDVVRSPLAANGRCQFSGTVDLPDRGRWFLYAELDHGGETVETWVPVHSGQAEQLSAARSLYIPPSTESSPLKWVAGVVAYLIVAALLLAICHLYRASTGRRSALEPHQSN